MSFLFFLNKKQIVKAKFFQPFEELKNVFFLSIRENQQIWTGPKSLIFGWIWLTNSLIVLMRGIRWCFHISNILKIMKNKKNSFDVLSTWWVKLKMHFLKKARDMSKIFSPICFSNFFAAIKTPTNMIFQKKVKIVTP